jgi:hypothetical protein
MIDLFVHVPGVEKRDFVNAEIRLALDQQADVTIKMFQRTHRTWNTAVRWNKKITVSGGDRWYSMIVSTNSDVYKWVTYGTGEHGRGMGKYIIPLTRGYGGKRLKYPKTYKRKTRPNVIGSRQGGKDLSKEGLRGAAAKEYFNYAVTVLHPGIKPRNFVEEIQRRRERPFARAMTMALRRIAARMFTGEGAMRSRRTFVGRSIIESNADM